MPLREVHVDVEERAIVFGVCGGNLLLDGQSLIEERNSLSVLSQFPHRHGLLAQQIGADASCGEAVLFRLRQRIEALLGELVVLQSLGRIGLNLYVADLKLHDPETSAGAGETGVDAQGAFIEPDVFAIRGKGTGKIAQARSAGLT